jgi:O-antigen/teichoic acid export membrane protein
MKLQNLATSSALYTAGNVLTKGVGILLLPLYTRYLSTSDYGVIELVELVVSLATMIFGLGMIGGAMVRVYYDYTDQKEKNQVISTAILSCIGASVLACLIGLWFAPVLAGSVLKDPALKSLLMASFAAVVFSSVFEVCMVYLRLKDRAMAFVIISLIQLVLTTSSNIFFIAYMDYGIWGFVLSKLLIVGVCATAMLAWLFREVGISWNRIKFHQMVKFGAPLVGAALAFFVIHFSDRFFLSKYGTLDDVGIYSLGYKFGFMITYLVGEPFTRAWSVSLFAFAQQENWKASFARIFFIFFFFLVLAWTALSYWSHSIIDVLATKHFRDAALIIPGVALAYVIRECGDFFKQLLFINKRTRTITWVTLFCALTNLGLNAVLTRHFKASGAVASSLITWSVYCATLFLLSQREFRIPYRIAGFAKLVGVSAVGFVISKLFHPQNLPLQLAYNAAVCGFFGLVVWKLRLFEPNELDYVRNAYAGLRAKARAVVGMSEAAMADASSPGVGRRASGEKNGETSE